METICSPTWKQSFGDKFKQLNELRTDRKYCEITLRSSDERNINAHRIILYIGSDFFKNAFTLKMKDSEDEIFEFKHMKGDILEKVISFIYTGEIHVNIYEDLEEIAQYANYLQIKDLIEICTNRLCSLINNNNCLKLWRLAHECFSENLEKSCISYVLTSKLFETETFLNDLDKDEMKKLLCYNNFQYSEEMKFEKALQWAKTKSNNNEEFSNIFLNFLESIRFVSISKHFIVNNILSNNDLLQNKEIIQKIVDLARCEWMDTNNKSLLKVSDLLKKQLWTSKEYPFAIFTTKIQILSREKTVEKFVSKLHNLNNSGYTTFNNYILSCGGKASDSNCALKFCEYFNITTSDWKYFPPMQNSRSNLECAFFENSIYACGGYNGSRITAVERYDFGEEKWFAGVNLKYGRSNFGLVSINRSLYAVCGCSTNSYDTMSNIERFDPRMSSEWYLVSSQSIADLYTQCISFGTDIYCFQKGKSPWIFDTKMNRTRECDGEIKSLKLSNDSFKICNVDTSINIISNNCNASGWKKYKFYEYSVKGDLIYSSNVNSYKNIFDIEACVALYCK